MKVSQLGNREPRSKLRHLSLLCVLSHSTLPTGWNLRNGDGSGSDSQEFHENRIEALARCLHCLEHRPIYQNVAGLISGQGTHLGCRFNT